LCHTKYYSIISIKCPYAGTNIRGRGYSGIVNKAYNKLVRDKIPQVIKANGGIPKTRVLADSEYLGELIKKLGEESREFEEAKSAEELADIQEVVNALAAAIGLSAEELESIRRQKAAERGGFTGKIFLQEVEE
jgi:predicted house-cleaning noncanonical NTP pyrophosphatase (MazG superfamily)